MNGWTGKIVIIDLKNEKVTKFSSDSKILHSYLGGRGLGVKLYYDMISRNIDPLSLENILIFASGPLTGTLAPLSGRHVMVSRSPLTGTIFDSSSGGFFGKELKSCGIDALIIKDRACEPVYITIKDDIVDIHPAGGLWGKNVRECTDELSAGGRVACIGRAGERLVPIANVMNDYFHACGRGGLGAVMGSKNLKAVVVKGTKRPGVADEKRFRDICREAAIILRKKSSSLSTYGTSTLLNLMNYMKIIPVRNFRDNEFNDAHKVSGEFIKENFDIKGRACYNCTIGCKHVIKSGLYEDYEIPEYETLWAFGPDNNNSDIEKIIRVNRICNDYGMDTISSGSTIAAYAEIIGKDIVDLEEYVRKMGENIDPAKHPGKGSGPAANWNDVSMQCKGLKLPGYDPRGLMGMALAYATSNRGGCHLKAYMAGPEVLGKPHKVDRLTFSGKPGLVKSVQDETAAIDSLVLCKFAGFSISNELFVDMLSAATGIDYSINEFLKCGERIWNIERLFNNKMGFTKEDDTLPERFFKDGGIDRIIFEKSLNEYYLHRGWNEKGVPAGWKLQDLGITS